MKSPAATQSVCSNPCSVAPKQVPYPSLPSGVTKAHPFHCFGFFHSNPLRRALNGFSFSVGRNGKILATKRAKRICGDRGTCSSIGAAIRWMGFFLLCRRGDSPPDKSEFEELVNCRNLASPCEGRPLWVCRAEGDRLRWRGRKTCGNVCKIDLSVILLRKMPAPLIEGEPSASFNSSLQILIYHSD